MTVATVQIRDAWLLPSRYLHTWNEELGTPRRQTDDGHKLEISFLVWCFCGRQGGELSFVCISVAVKVSHSVWFVGTGSSGLLKLVFLGFSALEYGRQGSVEAALRELQEAEALARTELSRKSPVCVPPISPIVVGSVSFLGLLQHFHAPCTGPGTWDHSERAHQHPTLLTCRFSCRCSYCSLWPCPS